MANFFLERRTYLTKRAGKTVSQNDIARMLNVTSSYVGQWERSELAPNLKLAAKLAEIYDVTLERMEREIALLTREVVARESRDLAAAH